MELDELRKMKDAAVETAARTWSPACAIRPASDLEKDWSDATKDPRDDSNMTSASSFGPMTQKAATPVWIRTAAWCPAIAIAPRTGASSAVPCPMVQGPRRGTQQRSSRVRHAWRAFAPRSSIEHAAPAALLAAKVGHGRPQWAGLAARMSLFARDPRALLFSSVWSRSGSDAVLHHVRTL